MNKPTLDKVRDYFYGRCNDGEEVRLQQWFADNGNSSEADRLLGTLLDEVRSENPALAQAAFEEFCRRIGHSVPARTAPRRLTTVVRWTQRIAAVLIVPLLIGEMMLTYDGNQKRYAQIAGHGFRILAAAMEKDLPYEIKCPALLICGTQDHAGSCIRYNKAWHRNTNIPLMWIEGAGHNSNTDKPEQVNRLIEEFVADIL